ncbi:hypothetical protein N7481_005035 [Penicillium waksmanii]|uniref:uncharacterized protein n=1 Tax=Penicillium waksmanii TaxID=69791 RepID=UPI0025473D14|nr:uncharacterized protein N7481_005035 [Penicillium waksmanii]KAJ5982936.1 hypothetical protein N7481_005035 [Penicillium waksmanii]
MWLNVDSNRDSRRTSDIACHVCRRRKVRCDRQWPQCLVCVETSQDCSYPEGPLKPGPKLGSLKRSRKRPLQRFEDDATSFKSKSLRKRPDYGILDTEPAIIDAHSQQNDSELHGSAPEADDEDIPAEKDGSDRPDSRSNIQNLSFILHPAHEATSPDKEQFSEPKISRNLQGTEIEKACAALGLTGACVSSMLKSYFDNMVAINLFCEPQFSKKLHGAVSSTHISALLAAMSAYAARFSPEEIREEWTSSPGESCKGQSPVDYFLTLAFKYVNEGLNECGDEPPSLYILQALIIATHLQLTQGVRGKAWRSLGTCIRLAYELDLHLIDSGCEDLDDFGAEDWCWKEEKRRAWWAIWEMDVFASTIRRTPPAIDWSQIETLLPVEDEHWFDRRPQPSCFMKRDPILRWRTLHESGNQSPKAWFLVVNSLMKEAQIISSPRSIPNRNPSRHQSKHTGSTDGTESTTALSEEANQRLETLANSVQCFILVLPKSLQYRNQYLNFEARAPGQVSSIRQDHCSIYNIYIMVQLAKLMIHRYDVFRGLSPGVKWEQEPGNPELQKPNITGSYPISDTNSVALAQYFEAADNILAIINRSTEDHIRYINPFLSSTIWLASAVQIFRQEFEHGETRRTFIKSKFEVLYMTYKQSVSWWNIHTALQQNLEAFEGQLENYRKLKDSPKSRWCIIPSNPSADQSRRPSVNSNPNNAPQITFSALETPPLSVISTELENGDYQRQNSPTGNSSYVFSSTQASQSKLNDLPIIDDMHLPFSERSDPEKQSYSQIDLNPSSGFLDPILSARSNPECLFPRYLANDEAFGQGVSIDVTNNIFDLLSGYSLY